MAVCKERWVIGSLVEILILNQTESTSEKRKAREPQQPRAFPALTSLKKQWA